MLYPNNQETPGTPHPPVTVIPVLLDYLEMQIKRESPLWQDWSLLGLYFISLW
jgi:hypothetical protein